MGELLDRHYQREILTTLQNVYPHTADIEGTWGEQNDNRLLVNLSYLSEHGLVDFITATSISGYILMISAKVTAKGMDFLANDGGLGAILGVVTVKLHEDTLRQLLIDKILAADGDGTTKASLVAKIKEIPSEALGAFTEKALDAGLDHLPDLLDKIRGWIF